MYEATIPLIYTSPIDKVNPLPTEDDIDCNDPSDIENCKMWKQLLKVEANVRNGTLLLNPNWMFADNKGKRSKKSLDFVGDFLNWCCGTATQKSIDTITMSTSSLENHLRELRKGIREELQNFGINSVSFKNYTDQVSEKFQNIDEALSFLKSYDTKTFRLEESKINKLAINIFKILVSKSFTVHLMARTLLLNQITTMCLTNKIPSVLISKQVLKDDLRKLNKTLNLDNKEIALDIADVSKLYTLPLTDCTFTEDSVTVHIKIPVKSQHISWKLLELTSAPYAWGNYTCTLIHEHTYVAVGKNLTSGREIIKILSGTSLHTCQPYDSKLCFIPNYLVDPYYTSECINYLYKGATVANIYDKCPLRCIHGLYTTITEIAHNKFFITRPNEFCNIVCKSATFPLKPYSTLPGAVLVDLPCDCNLVEGGEIIIGRRFPCLDEERKLTIHHTIPAAWTNVASLLINPKATYDHPIYDNLSECFNPKWTQKVPHFVIAPTHDLSRVDEALERLDDDLSWYSTNFVRHGDTVIVTWNLVNTVVILYVIYRVRNVGLVPLMLPTARADTLATVVISSASISVSFLVIAIFWLFIYKCIKRKALPSTVAGTIELPTGELVPISINLELN